MLTTLPGPGFPVFRPRTRGFFGPRARTAALFAACVVPQWFGATSAPAYRFDPAERRLSRVPRSADATKWRRSIWGPGRTLTWEVLDDGGWSPHFSDVSQVVRLLSDAADSWTQIPSADIQWEVAGPTTRRSGNDRRNVLSVADLDGFAGYASWWANGTGPRGAWEITNCDIRIDPSFVESLASDEDGSGLHVLVHELGHCIGLHHAATGPASGNDFWLGPAGSVLLGPDPTMSYGLSTGDLVLGEDDAVGASLLRPARGWLETTGSVSGTLTVDGEPAPFVSVQLFSTTGESTRRSVQVFSDEKGSFLAEGLTPGVYVLWIHPVLLSRAHPALIRTGKVPRDLVDTLAVQTAVVRRGRETMAGEFALRRGNRRPG